MIWNTIACSSIYYEISILEYRLSNIIVASSMFPIKNKFKNIYKNIFKLEIYFLMKLGQEFLRHNEMNS